MKKYLVLLALALLSACGGPAQSVQPTAPRSASTAAPATNPTSVPPTQTPALLVQPAAPVAASATPAASDTSASGKTATVAFAYLWPAYLPDGMRISPSESRVARENEIGTTGTGFYLVTFNGEGRKLVVGGGATDTLPLTGDARQVSYDNGQATLTTNGDQRQLVFVHNGAKFFLYGRGISEQELMLVAESMVPTDVAALREQVDAAK